MNSISVTKSWIGEDEEGEEHHHPGEQQHDDLDEVLEEGDVAHQAGDRFQDRPAGIEADLGDAAGPQKIGGGEPRAGRLQAEAGEALEDDLRESVPVADDVGEDADEQRLLDQPRDDVVVGAPAPEQRGERDVDDDQGRGEEGDLAAEQAEAGIDVAGEDLEETIDDAGAAHQRASAGLLLGAKKRRRFSAQTRRQVSSAASCSAVTSRQRARSAAIGSLFVVRGATVVACVIGAAGLTDGDDDGRDDNSDRGEAQKGADGRITLVSTFAVVAQPALITGTSALWSDGSPRRGSGSAGAAHGPAPAQRRVARLRGSARGLAPRRPR